MSSALAAPAISPAASIANVARAFVVVFMWILPAWLSVVVQNRASTIDGDRLGIDERRFVRSEKNRRHCNFVRPANALGRMKVVGPPLLLGRVGKRVPIGLRDRRLDVAGGDRIHADAARRIFDGERA